MSTKKFLFFVFIWMSFFGFSQNMKQGFSYLENGHYESAVQFFKDILATYPENKTARLCYGRAVGLNGNSAEAKRIFEDLLTKYPNDFEVQLNFGESLLWNNEFDLAEAYYEKLVKKDAQSFPALLGFANTLSNVKKYEKALLYVNEALHVSPGNPNALLSKKYMYLGFAYQKQQQQEYQSAENILKESLVHFPNDTDALLNLANLYLIMNAIDSAEKTYQTLLADAETLKASLAAQNGLALTFHLKGKDKKALKTSETAYYQLNTSVAKTTAQQTTERYIQALIWNNKYTEAQQLINQLAEIQPTENWLLALRATLSMYKSDFKQSLAAYEQILVNDSTSFDGNLGKANALKALGRFEEAYIAANKTLSFYKHQKDALNFIKELDMKFSAFYDGKTSYTFDNGNNNAFSINNSVELPFSTRLRLLGNYTFRTTSNSVTDAQANSHALSAGMKYQLRPNVEIKGRFGATTASAESKDYIQFIADVSLSTRPFKLQTLEIGYQRELQSFNAELLNSAIVQNNFYANYNLSTNANLGWFTQYYYTTQNDDNSRHLLFTSLYYNIMKKPSLKVGFNYQYLTFEKQVPSIYFSPKRFNAGELFLNLIRDEHITKKGEWFYELTAATGVQYIEDQERQSTYRFQGKLGYKFSESGFVNVFGTRSNIASATAAGFTFTEIGVRLKWVFSIEK